MYENSARGSKRASAEFTDALPAADDRPMAYLDIDENGYPVAANSQPRGEAALLAIIRRALEGDPYPVSGGTEQPTVVEDTHTPLAARIRDILHGAADTGSEDDQSVDGDEAAHELQAAAALLNQRVDAAFDYDGDLLWEADHHDDMETPLPAPMPFAADVLHLDDAAVEMPAIHRPRLMGLGSIAFIAFAALLGAGAPALLLSQSPRFVSETRLQAERDVQPGWLDAVAHRIVAPHSLSQAVGKLKLDRDPEFTGAKSGAIGVALDLVSGAGSASDAPSRAQAALHDAVSVSVDDRSGVLRLSVTTGEADKSARIANLLADAAVYDATLAQGAMPAGASSPADVARGAYDRAVAALDAFKTATGADRIAAAVELQRQRQELDGQIQSGQKAAEIARRRAEAAKETRSDDILNGGLSPDLLSPAVDDLRTRYTAARLALAQLSVQLGPRHPRLLAQQAVVDGLKGNADALLKRIVSGTDADLKAALANQKMLSDRMTLLSRKTVDVDMARLAQLQGDADTAQKSYEAAVNDIGAAQTPPRRVPLSVATSAVASAAPLADDLAPAEMAGAFFGFGIAACIVLLRALALTALSARDGGGAAPLAAAGSRHVEPDMRAPQPLQQPAPRFNADIAVANDRPFADGPDRRPVPHAEFELVRRDITSLRSRIEAYAQSRAAGQH